MIDLLVVTGDASGRSDAIRILGEELHAGRAEFPSHRAPRPTPRPKPRRLEPIEDPGGRLSTEYGQWCLDEYLEFRRWSAETANHFDLHPVRRHGEVMIRHLFKAAGHLYTAQDRRTSNKEPKWLALGGAPLIPFNLDALAVPGTRVIVTEGPADAISLHDEFGQRFRVVGFPGSMSARQEWLNALTEACDTVFVACDSDDAGDNMFADLKKKLPLNVCLLYTSDAADE